MNSDLPSKLISLLKESLSSSLDRLRSDSVSRGIFYLNKAERVVGILQKLQNKNKFKLSDFAPTYREINQLQISIQSILEEDREIARKEIIQLELKKDLRIFLMGEKS